MARLLFCALAILATSQALVTAHSIAPTLYTLDLFLDTQNNKFSGSLSMDATVKKSGETSFMLNSNDLNITTISVIQGGSNIFSTFVLNQTEQTLRIFTSTGLASNAPIKVNIAYQGNVSTDPTGLYSFVDGGKTIYMTNLYPIYARKLFPCFDEPGMPTAVALSVTVPQENGQLIGSSNITNVSTLKNGYHFYQLGKTIPIAPYSLFFTLGNWDSNTFSVGLQNSVVYVPPSLSRRSNIIDINVAYAAANPNITQLVPFFGDAINPINIFITPALATNSYSGLRTVVLKKDIAVTNLLEMPSEYEKNNLLEISNAFFRMFFGTLNPPSNWGNNWLARSIPMYLSYESLNYVGIYGAADPSYVNGLYEQVFRSCVSPDSPVAYTKNALTNPRDILNFVNSVGAEKGAYALKTLETFINPANLRSSIIAYLIQTNGKTMETMDFINFLNSSLSFQMTGGNLTDVLFPMISETGYPLIQLSRNQETLSMLKSTFTVLNSPRTQSLVETTKLRDVSNWLIPITAATWTSPSTQNYTVYFVPQGSATARVVLQGTYPDNGWALLNLDGKGMMRVSYDPTSVMLFRNYAMTGFSTAMRAKITSDLFANAESSNDGLNWHTSLAYMDYLEGETDLAPVQAAIAGMRRMWPWIYQRNQTINNAFNSYWQNRFINLYNKLGTKGTNNRDDAVRWEVVNTMCDLGVSNCTADLAAQYLNYINNGVRPSADMFYVVMCNGIKDYTTTDQWNSLYQDYVQSGMWYSQQLLNTHYRILACPRALIQSYMNTVLLNTAQYNFPQDQVIYAVRGMLYRPEHLNAVLSFFVQNEASLNITEDVKAAIVAELGQRISTTTQVQQLSLLTNTSRGVSPAVFIAVQNAIEAGTRKASWVSTVESNVLRALEGDNPTPTTVSPPTSQPTTSPTGGSTNGTTPEPPSSTTPKGNASSMSTSILTLFVSLILLKIAL